MTEGHWIFADNLEPCLSIVAGESGAAFSAEDWEAVKFGLKGTSDVRDRWFRHRLEGIHGRLDFECALDDGDTGSGIVHVRFVDLATAETAAKLSTVLQICAHYALK